MKRIVVLGGTGGIGSAVTEAFKQSEYFDVHSYGHKDLDVTKFKDFGKLPRDIDCLINCAGYFNENDYPKMNKVNVEGALNSVIFPLHYYKMQEGGYIFVLTSSAGIRHNDEYPLYSFTKKKAEERVKNLAEEAYNDWGVFVNTIAPCRVRTKMRSNITDEWEEELALEPEEVAEFIFNLYTADLRLYGHTFDLRMAYKRK